MAVGSGWATQLLRTKLMERFESLMRWAIDRGCWPMRGVYVVVAACLAMMMSMGSRCSGTGTDEFHMFAA